MKLFREPSAAWVLKGAGILGFTPLAVGVLACDHGLSLVVFVPIDTLSVPRLFVSRDSLRDYVRRFMSTSPVGRLSRVFAASGSGLTATRSRSRGPPNMPRRSHIPRAPL